MPEPEQCPNCGAPLAYCHMGDYCSKSCGYVDGYVFPPVAETKHSVQITFNQVSAEERVAFAGIEYLSPVILSRGRLVVDGKHYIFDEISIQIEHPHAPVI